MRRFTLAIVVFVLVAVVIVGRLGHRARPGERPRAPSLSSTVPSSGAPLPARPSKIAGLRAEISSDSISPIANDLNAPGGSIYHDLEILNDVFVAWQTNFPQRGNPVGENDEITAALAGDNPLHFAWIAPTHGAINGQGQLCDRWGTPFRFHQLSGTVMEIRSAGPDRRFGTTDDVQFAPGRNTP